MIFSARFCSPDCWAKSHRFFGSHHFFCNFIGLIKKDAIRENLIIFRTVEVETKIPMAKMNQKTTSDTHTQNINLISSGTKIVGDIISEGDIRIDGQLKGNISSKGRLVIGESGTIEGEIECANIEISGIVKGRIHAADLLSMKASATIVGDIVAGKLSVEPGSVFTGSCKMGENPA